MSTVIKPKRSETALSIPSTGALAVGELAMNVTDGKFYTKTSGNVVKEIGGAGSVTLQDVVTNGASSNVDILLDGSNLVFEGFLANAYETTLTVQEPTVDRTVTLPNRTGTVLLRESGRNVVIEGTSYNTTLTTSQPTAARTQTFADVTGTIITTGNLTVDGTTTGDTIVGEGDALAYSIVFGS